MAFQPVPNVAEVVLRFVTGTDPDSSAWVVQNTHHWRRSLGWTQAKLDELASDVNAWWTSDLKAVTSEDLKLYDIQVRDIGDEFGLTSTLVPDSRGTDTGTVEAVYCAVVQWHCDAGSPPRSGRTFFGGLNEDEITRGILDTGVGSAIQAAYDNLRDVTVSASAALVIVSRFSGVNPTTKKPIPRDPALSNTIGSVTVRNTVGVQKKRRPH